MARDVELIRFNALRNALYHTARRRSFERWNRLFNFLVVALGAAALTDLLPHWKAYLGGATAIIGALQLVFDFGGAARTHQALQRDYFSLVADIEEASDEADDRRRTWEGKLLRISADEPPTLRALDAKAYNDAIDALEWGEGERLELKWYHGLLSTFWSFDGASFKKLKELNGAGGLSGPSTPPTVPAE